MNIEKWKTLIYNGIEYPKYECSTFGRIRVFETQEIKSPYLNNKGYFCLSLWINKKTKKIQISRAVAFTFITNIENKKEVNHIDANTKNNNIENLEWNTRLENVRHSWENNLCSTKHLIGNNFHGKKVFAVELNKSFDSIIECAKFLIENNITKSKNIRTVKDYVSKSILENTMYYKIKFQKEI